MQSLGPAILALLGFMLMFFCMYTEGEPTAIPLLLIIISGVWYAAARIHDRRKSVR